MRLLPAIDLKDGTCVRLVEGRAETATVYSRDPGAQARHFARAGARWVHVVDLDGAFTGRPQNRRAVEAILAAGLRVQLGGGLRSLEAVAAAFDLGVERVVLGTAAVRDAALLEAVCDAYPGQVLVGVDARDGEVAIEGWTTGSGCGVSEVARRAKFAGAAGLLYTDIRRDGTGRGVNVEATCRLADEVGLPVVASGGVRGASDLEALARHPGITAAIAGRAVYQGDLDLPRLLGRYNRSDLYPSDT
ncbi:MAG: 1-(5-phosphoribosyl)-5-[(5-phosphoribosylamino)methylideneamino]imidazole-4-carboxamide isomerase [Deltaproteobacteria bacterium]|nr:MAG: 1-(5-phosphoribosyl)-5-[(5-phosphoribosylamino)methylideneamino]imidazole-4-carboxamide isomerase [Deltaproteobacteria bacterium]